MHLLNRAFSGLGREFLGVGSSTILDRGSRLASSLTAAALIGPTDWGVWFIVNLVIVYGSLTHLGSPNGMNLEVPSALGRNEEGLARRLEGASAAVLAGSLVTVWIVFIGLAASGVTTIAPGLLLAAALLLTAHQAYTFATMVLRARMQFPTFARLQVISAVSFPITVIPATYFWRLEGFVVAQAIQYALLAGWVITTRGPPFRFVLDRVLARRTIRVGFPIMMVGLTFALFSTVDRWIVASVLGTESLGHYSLAIMALNTVGLLPRTVSQQIYPRMAYAWSAEGRREALMDMAALQRRMALMATLPVAAILAVLAPWVVRNFLPAYTPGIPALLIALATPVLYTFGQGYGNVFNVVGMRRAYLALIVFATVVNAGASLALVHVVGLTGVAVGSLVGFVALAVALVALGNRLVRIHATKTPVALAGSTGENEVETS